jgi:hypothetical protein
MRELARVDPIRPRDRWTRKLDFIVWPKYGTFGRSRWYQVRRAWDESAHPRVPAGSPDGGQFGEGGGGGGGSDRPSSGKGGKGKKGKVKGVEDFRKDKIEVNSNKTDKFIESWNDAIGLDPGEFHEKFTGGLKSTMEISHRYHEHSDGDVMTNELRIDGKLLDENGRNIGTYTREIDLKNNKAESAYFALNSGAQGKGEGKQLLAANVALYQELGLDEVKVHANIDVGGYAWAKYGYVPTEDSWDTLRGTLREKLDEGGGGGGGYTPDEWEAMSSSNQDAVFEHWAEASKEEFHDSEVESWRESGEPLQEAKYELARDYYLVIHGEGNWATDAMKEWREGRDESVKPIPFTNEQILEAIVVDYARQGDGSDDPEIDFDDDKLDELGADLVDPTLPGIEEIKPHELLTEDMRKGIKAELTHAFNKKAEKDADDKDPPDYIDDSIEEQQRDVWDNMSDRERMRYAERNDLVESISDDYSSEGPAVLVDDEEKQMLYELLNEEDPKTIWALADSPGGKELLLGSDWYGAIKFSDKDTMTRFNAYVGGAKPSAAKAAA